MCLYMRTHSGKEKERKTVIIIIKCNADVSERFQLFSLSQPPIFLFSLLRNSLRSCEWRKSVGLVSLYIHSSSPSSFNLVTSRRGETDWRRRVNETIDAQHSKILSRDCADLAKTKIQQEKTKKEVYRLIFIASLLIPNRSIQRRTKKSGPTAVVGPGKEVEQFRQRESG